MKKLAWILLVTMVFALSTANAVDFKETESNTTSGTSSIAYFVCDEDMKLLGATSSNEFSVILKDYVKDLQSTISGLNARRNGEVIRTQKWREVTLDSDYRVAEGATPVLCELEILSSTGLERIFSSEALQKLTADDVIDMTICAVQRGGTIYATHKFVLQPTTEPCAKINFAGDFAYVYVENWDNEPSLVFDAGALKSSGPAVAGSGAESNSLSGPENSNLPDPGLYDNPGEGSSGVPNPGIY